MSAEQIRDAVLAAGVALTAAQLAVDSLLCKLRDSELELAENAENGPQLET